MFYTGTTGSVKSFNYGITVNSNTNNLNFPGTREIANMHYGVCIAAVPGYCSIRWSQAAGDDYSFTITDSTIGAAVAPGLPSGPMSGTSCTTDFIIIPSPMNQVVDRFCGNQFVTATCTY